MPAQEKFLPKVIVRVNKKGVFNEETAPEWFWLVWCRQPRALLKEAPEHACVGLLPRPHDRPSEEGSGEHLTWPRGYPGRDVVDAAVDRRIP